MSVRGISKAAVCCGSAKRAANAVHAEEISLFFMLADDDRSGCQKRKKNDKTIIAEVERRGEAAPED